jgi:pyruvate dehydrogenase E2 component (dihydrolipoamide acetyltransferase)
MTLAIDGPAATNPASKVREFRMPSLGADMQAGTVVEWRVKQGDLVNRGDVIAVVETDKGAIDVDIFASGQVEQVLVPAGAHVPVGTPLALLRGEGIAEAGPFVAPPVPSPPPTVAPAPAGPPVSLAVAASAQVPAGSEGRRVSPLARKMAADVGLDLATIRGTGRGGAINQADVERAAALGREAPRAIPGAPTSAVVRQAAMRRAIAAAMARSNQEIPHYYLESTIDLHRALAWLQEQNLKRPITDRLLPAVVLLKAVALATHEAPELNGFWIDGQLEPSEAIHLGVAISLRTGGMVTPAIHDSDLKSLDELSLALRDLVTRARGGGLRSSELTDPTLTVTNLGDLGADKVFGMIYPPQVALVGFGAIAERPWAIDGLLGIRPVVTATLDGDHRASDGHRGSRFLSRLAQLLQQPEVL